MGIGETIYVAAHVVLIVAIGWHFWKTRHRLWQYLAPAVAIGLMIVLAQIARGAAVLTQEELGLYIITCAALSVRLTVFAMVGMDCSESLGVRPFRMFQPGEGRPLLLEPLITSVMCGLAFAGFTVILLELTDPRFETTGLGWNRWVLGVAIAPLVDELVYRLGIQNFLARLLRNWNQPYWIAIVLTSVLFALGPLGVRDTGTARLLQMLPISLVLGWLYHRYGFESSWLAHTLFTATIAWAASS